MAHTSETGTRRSRTLPSSASARARVSAFFGKAYRDGLTGLAGMVAYNLLLSLLPLTLVALFIFGQVVRSPDVETSVISDIHRLLPSASGANLAGLLREIRHSSTSIGIAALLSSIWIGSSFWGAIDTAFCRIYRSPSCRTWLQQKRFALVMLLVVLALFAATVVLPALQSIVVDGADHLPFGLNAQRTVYVVTLVLGIAILFGVLATIYRVVPNERVPWRAVWPGALGATLVIALVDYTFPLYLDNSVLSTFGGTYVFVLIVLVWFYAVSLILLGGAVLNALRLGRAEPDPS